LDSHTLVLVNPRISAAGAAAAKVQP